MQGLALKNKEPRMGGAEITADLSSWRLDAEDPACRRPTRDAVLRYPDFMDRFDARTVIFDLYRTSDPTLWEAVCPPLLNMAEDLEMTVIAQPSGREVPVRRLRRIMVERLEFIVPEGTRALEFHRPGLPVVTRTPMRDLTPDFAGLRVVTTLSKDNDLVWIRDWAQFYVSVHGADAVLFYDNASTRTTHEGIARALGGVTGLKRFGVVDWPFPYGPNDHRRDQTLWLAESDFCQRGMFEHARCRALRNAACVINADVDELIVDAEGRALCTTVETSEKGYIEAPGRWVEAAHDGRAATQRHAAYAMRLDQDQPFSCEPKWAIVPSRLHPEVQWHAHKVIGAEPDFASVGFEFGHFRAINTNWDMHESANTAQRRTDGPGAQALREIPHLRAALERAFPDRSAGWIDTPPLDLDGGAVLQNIAHQSNAFDRARQEAEGGMGYWVHRAYMASRLQDGDAAAADFALKALSLAPPRAVFPALAEAVKRLARANRLAEAPALLERCRAQLGGDALRRHTALSAWVLTELGQLRKAREILAPALDLAPQRAGYWLLEATLALDLGDAPAADSALEQTRSALASPDRLPDELSYIEEVLETTGILGLRDYFGLEVARPELYHLRLLPLLRARGKDAAALATARALADEQPLTMIRHYNLAQLAGALGDRDLAEQAKSRCLALARDRATRGHIGNPNAREAQLHDWKVRMDLVSALCVNGRTEEGRALAREFGALPLPEPSLPIGAARALSGAGDHDGALALLSDALRHTPDEAKIGWALAGTLAEAGQPGEAAARVSALLAQKDADLGAAHRLASTLVADAPREAADVYALLLARAPGSLPVPVLRRAAVAARRARATPLMLDAARRLVSQAPDLAEAHFLLGQARRASGDLVGALGAVEAALSRDPDHAGAQSLRAQLKS